MSTKQTVDDLYDRRYHNQPGTGWLSIGELETIEAGRAALSVPAQDLRPLDRDWPRHRHPAREGGSTTGRGRRSSG